MASRGRPEGRAEGGEGCPSAVRPGQRRPLGRDRRRQRDSAANASVETATVRLSVRGRVSAGVGLSVEGQLPIPWLVGEARSPEASGATMMTLDRGGVGERAVSESMLGDGVAALRVERRRRRRASRRAKGRRRSVGEDRAPAGPRRRRPSASSSARGSHAHVKVAPGAASAVVFVGTRYDAHARDGHGPAKPVLRSSVACDEEREFRPRGAVILGVEEIDRARCRPSSAFGIAHGSDCDDAGGYSQRSGQSLVVRRPASEAASFATWPYVAPPSVVRKT